VTIPVAYPLTVYYDASCPLCRAEMETLESRAMADALRLVDCSAAGFDERTVAAEGITRADLMSRIHARDDAGRWLRGMDVFAAVYAAAGLNVLARIYASRALRPLLDRLYPWIADHRQALSRFGLPQLFAWLARKAPASCRDCARRPSRRDVSVKMPPSANR